MEVVYALPLEQDVDLSSKWRRERRWRQALAASGILARHPDIDLRVDRLGIWGRPATLDALLREGDRVEIYRPLQVDPKEVRRRARPRKRQLDRLTGSQDARRAC